MLVTVCQKKQGVVRGAKGSGKIIAEIDYLPVIDRKGNVFECTEEERAIFFVHHLVTVSIVRHARHFAPHFVVWSCASPTRVAVALQPVAIPDIAIFHLLKR